MLPAAKARKLLTKYCIESPADLNLEELANAEGLIIEDADLHNCDGSIIFGDGYGLIKISSRIHLQGQRNFITAHELGHFYNEERKKGGCAGKDFLMTAGGSLAEQRANQFAVELLMPREWFKDFVKGKKLSLTFLKDISEYFNISLSSAALRYSDLGPSPTAVIMSVNGEVKWSSINHYFPFNWIPNGYKVNNNSYAYDIFESFNGKDTNFSCETCKVNEVLADSWFLEDRNYKKDYFISEVNFPMPNYNAVLTILYESEYN